MAKRPITPYEKKRRMAEKRLGQLNYTPQAATFLSGILCALTENPDREARLRAFEEIAREKVKNG